MRLRASLKTLYSDDCYDVFIHVEPTRLLIVLRCFIATKE